MRIVVPPGKIDRYLLNQDHPVGAGKARFFQAKGFDLRAPGVLEDALVEHSRTAMLAARTAHPDGYLLVYECRLRAPDQSEPCIRSVWIEDVDLRETRLVTAYPFA